MRRTILKTIFTIGFMALCTLVFAQQSGSIKGKVLTSDGNPADMISVLLAGTNQGAVSNAKGEYKINNVKPGTYTIKASAVGANVVQQTVTVSAGQFSTVDFNIAYTSSQLHEVNISAAKTNKFAVKKSVNAAKMPLSNLENPQAVVSINSSLMKDQAITNFSDAVKNAPGLDKIWTSTGRSGDGAAYYTLRGFSTQASLVNGVPGITNGDIDPQGIEKIEVIKGPSGTLYGGAVVNFGGLINIVTKKASIDTIGGEVAYSTGTFGLNRITGDVYGALNASKTAMFRLNTAYHDQNSWQDAGFRKSIYVAPALRFNLNEKATLDLGAEFYNYQGTNPLMVFLNRSRALISKNIDELNFDWNKSYTNNDMVVKTPSTNVHAELNYKINENWTSQSLVGQSYRKSDGYYQYVMYLDANNTPSDRDISRMVGYQNGYSTTTDLQQNFIGDFKIGNFRNRMVVGLDYLSQFNNNNSSPYVRFDVLNTNAGQTPSTYGLLNRAAVDALIAAASTAPATAGQASKGTSKIDTYSAYINDVFNITDKLIFSAGIRVDRFNNRGTYNNLTGITSPDYLQTAWSPKLGLLFQPIKDQISVFANYLNGFKNVAPGNRLIDGAIMIAAFEPQHAEQFEGGVKLDVFKNKLSLTTSYYDIKVNNYMMAMSVNIGGTNYNYNVQDGTQISRGFEADLAANPIEGLNLNAGYTYNYSRITNAGPQTNGRRPVGAGPKQMVNFWASYKQPFGTLKGLGAGFGGNYASENIITNTLTTGTFSVPSYTVLNGTVFYEFSKFRAGIKVDNLTDKQYFKGWTTIEVQQPRAFIGTFSMSF